MSSRNRKYGRAKQRYALVFRSLPRIKAGSCTPRRLGTISFLSRPPLPWKSGKIVTPSKSVTPADFSKVVKPRTFLDRGWMTREGRGKDSRFILTTDPGHYPAPPDRQYPEIVAALAKAKEKR